jgi:sulfide:quinone oxidoreductase
VPGTGNSTSRGGLRVVIVGGGVAGLETLLALHSLAGDRVDMELVSAEPKFWYRPLSVAEPFGTARALSFDLAGIAGRTGAGLTLGRIASVDGRANVARTSQGATIEYDALVVACGAQARPVLPGASTFRGPADTEAFRRLLAEAERGDVGSIAFAVPEGSGWPLPLYELALLTANHLRRRAPQVRLTLVTPEDEPLSLFGAPASESVRALLAEHDIALLTGRPPVRFEDGTLELPSGAGVRADRVVALPRLEGPRILGLPQDADGFVPTELSGRIWGLESAFAAGDVTQFPVKQGGIATEQADAVAEAIAAQAGTDVEPRRFRPVLRAILITGREPVYLRHEISGGTVADEALWWPPAKIVGRYLAPFLAGDPALTRP